MYPPPTSSAGHAGLYGSSMRVLNLEGSGKSSSKAHALTFNPLVSKILLKRSALKRERKLLQVESRRIQKEKQRLLEEKRRLVEEKRLIRDQANRSERMCCLLVLNLVSSTLPCIRQPRPRLRVLDICGFVSVCTQAFIGF